MKFIHLSPVLSAFRVLDFASVSSSASHCFPPSHLWRLLLNPCSLSLPWEEIQLSSHLANFFSFSRISSDVPTPPLSPFFSLSLHHLGLCHCKYQAVLFVRFLPITWALWDLQSAAFHLCMRRHTTWLIYSRKSINVSNELMKLTQRNIYLMEEFHIGVRSSIYH